MDELNKNQIVLLVLLVSFVTSIATGIVTVTLMDQAPPGLTQTINRVVEHTIERTVPGETKTTTVVKEVPVLITEEQIISDLVQSESPGVVFLMSEDGATSLGSAFIISNDGQIITANHLLGKVPTIGQKFTVVLEHGQKIDAQLIKLSTDSDIALLQANQAKLASLVPKTTDTTSTSSPAKAWTALEIAEAESFPGQTVVTLGATSDGSINVTGGIVSSLVTSAAASDIVFIKTNAVNDTNLGGPIFNTKGKVIGLSTAPGTAVSTRSIKNLISNP